MTDTRDDAALRQLAAVTAERDDIARQLAVAREALGEAVRILDFAFTEGALTHKQIISLYVDPYGALADMKAALAQPSQRTEREG